MVAREAPSEALTCGNRSACASRSSARAACTRAAACCRSVLLAAARSTRSSSTGSENTVHHAPRGCASAGPTLAKRAAPSSLKATGAAGTAAGVKGALAQPASTSAATSGSSEVLKSEVMRNPCR